MTPSSPMTLEKISDREIVIRRTFRASAPVVYDAWTKPELVKRWWAPTSRGVTMFSCDAEVRVGGRYRYVLAMGDEEQFTFSGEYLELDRPSRLVYTQVFEAFPDSPATITVTLEEVDGVTHLTSQEAYPSAEALEAALSSGMEDGARESLDQLEALVSAQ